MFGKDGSRTDGLHPYCRECKNAAARARWVPSGRTVMTAEERVANKREIRRQWRERQGAEAMREYNRAYVDANRARHNERGREYRRKNPGYGTATARRWRELNREHTRALGRVNVSLRRSRLAEVLVIPFTNEQLASRLAVFGFRCWMCGAPWAHLDHVKPITAGGPHILANLRPACASCNSRKKNTWPYDTRVSFRRAP